jgi:hypothetical protein
VQKYLLNARRALEKEDWDEVEKYYNLVEQNEPSNIEAIFYSAYGKAKASLSVNEIYKRQAIFKALRNSISILDDNYSVENSAECNAVMERIVNDVINMFGSSFVYTEKTDGYGFKSDNKVETYTLFIGLGSELYATLNNIADKIPKSKKEDLLFARKLQLRMIDFMTTPASQLSNDSMIQNCGVASRVVAMIKELDPSFVGKDYEARKQSVEEQKKTNAGCTVFAVVFIFIIAIVIGVAIGLS